MVFFQFKGHKLIFAAISPVFERILYTDQKDCSRIALDEVEPNAFRTLRK